jgi:hypothetical protein
MPEAVPDRLYDCNDGGLDVSENAGRTFTNRSNGLSVTMFYDMDVAQSNGLVYGGGAQDNGTVVTTSGSVSSFFELLGGDGGWIVFDPANEGRVYASYYNLNIFRFRGEAFKNVSPPAPKAEKNSIWMAYITWIRLTRKLCSRELFRVWRTRNDGNNWTPVSPSLDGSSSLQLKLRRQITNAFMLVLRTEDSSAVLMGERRGVRTSRVLRFRDTPSRVGNEPN